MAFSRERISVRGLHHSGREEGDGARERKSEHVSVMLKEALDALDLKKGEVVLDATLGTGGHSEAMLASAPVQVFALDADPAALVAAGKRLGRHKKRATLIEANFADVVEALANEGVTNINKALFDLGWNRTQLSAGRGFSFLHDEPLHMGYSEVPRSQFTAAQALNTWQEHVLADAIFGYGEERYARRIAKAIVARRKIKEFVTTLELVEVINDAVPAAYRRGRLHPATRTFQALRMAVNDELGAIDKGVRGAWHLLQKGGRIAVITFHSVEDRAVKRLFVSFVKEHGGKLVYKKPLGPTATEIEHNPSARSAKLRVIEKCENRSSKK